MKVTTSALKSVSDRQGAGRGWERERLRGGGG